MSPPAVNIAPNAFLASDSGVAAGWLLHVCNDVALLDRVDLTRFRSR